jgi:hypothetical protein
MSGTPPYAYRPDFTASEVDCFMPKSNEIRSRLWAGGTFFRSINVGESMNFIELNIVNTINNTFVLTINRRDPITNDILETETYSVDESVTAGSPEIPPDPLDPLDPGTPATPDKSTALPALRLLVNTYSNIIRMKERAINADGVPVMPPPDIHDSSGDATTISSFLPILMSGAQGGPTPPPPALRTGPERSMWYIESSEYHAPLYPGDPAFNNEDGHLSAVYKTIQWNGDIHSWIAYTPFT